MNQPNGLRKRPEEIINAVKEDPALTPEEKETNLSFAKLDDRVRVYTEEAGISRGLLSHSYFDTRELRVNMDGRVVRMRPEAYTKGTVTGVEGFIPIGTVKISARPRSNSQHALIVSDEA